MPEPQRQIPNARTYYADASDLDYETLEQSQGCATVIAFRLPEESVCAGDVLVLLDGAEIRFHGIVSNVDGTGKACAADRRGSTLVPRAH